MTPCPHTHSHPTRHTKSNGANVVRLQCDRCGAGLGEKPKNQFPFDQLPVFDTVKFEQWQQREQAARRQECLLESVERDADWWQRYREYLQSPHWRHLRLLVLERDGICTVCYEAPPAQAHHVSYQSFDLHGLSFPNECAAICADCHNRLHEKDPR